jgi:hypothetical protein
MTASSIATVTYHPWTTYIYAREEARRRGDRRVGTEHLVLGLLHDPAIEAALGVSLQVARDTLDTLDRQALGLVGIGPALDAPPLPMRETPARPTLKAVVKDRLPLTPGAKRALQESGKPMRRGQKITPQQVLVGLLDLQLPDPSAALLGALELDTAAVRQHLGASPAA